MTAGPLARFTVLDLTRVRAGPTCVRYLADWGANCIKIEMPPGAGDMDMGGPRHGPDFQNLHRNKKSITLNLKEPDGKAVFMKLVEKADVVVENYRADVKFRLGIDYESLKKVNPRIILGSISGFGQDGPYAERAGFDQIAQGMGGLMWVTGMPGGGPVRAGIAVADVGAGLHCAIGILIALLERDSSGEGQWVSSSLLQAMISICDFQAARWTIARTCRARPATIIRPRSRPACSSPGRLRQHRRLGRPHLQALLRALKAPELLTDERFSTDKARVKNRDVLNDEIDKRLGDVRQRRVDREPEQGGRAGRADLQDGRDVRRSAGQAPEDGASGEVTQARRHRVDRPGDQHEPHALRDAHGDTRAGRAHRGGAEGGRLRRQRPIASFRSAA